MERIALQKLIDWKTSPDRKPLLVRGARQVGKTWLMRDFGENHFDQTAYLNLEENAQGRQIFQASLSPTQLIPTLELLLNQSLAAETLLILDEIQAAPAALTALKYFQEQAPHLPVIGAGSLLGVALQSSASFPVGKVEFLDLAPLNFTEFLWATDRKRLADQLESEDWSLINLTKALFIEALRQYLVVGGMPAAVSLFSQGAGYEAIQKTQADILTAYELDIARHAPPELFPRLNEAWQSIPAQLAKESRKFTYKQIREGARGRDYEQALLWLEGAGIIHRVSRVSKPEAPLKAFEERQNFKIYLADVGLLARLSQLDPRVILDPDGVFLQFRGALSEQFVLQELIAQELDPRYWSAPNAQAEVDFVIQQRGQVYPLEVKAATNLNAKSLRSYRQRFSPKQMFRLSLADYARHEGLTDLPLFAANQLTHLIASED